MSTQDIINNHSTSAQEAWTSVQEMQYLVLEKAYPTDESLLEALEEINGIMDGYEGLKGRLEQEAFRRMEERGAKAIPSINYICEIQQKSDYDQLAFTPLKEIFNSDDLKRCLTPAHTKEIEVPERWATTTVKAVAAKYGDRAKAIVENARTETRGRLKFARRDR